MRRMGLFCMLVSRGVLEMGRGQLQYARSTLALMSRSKLGAGRWHRVTPSHNRPDNGGFKYHSPNSGSAGADVAAIASL